MAQSVILRPVRDDANRVRHGFDRLVNR